MMLSVAIRFLPERSGGRSLGPYVGRAPWSLLDFLDGGDTCFDDPAAVVRLCTFEGLDTSV